jgi:hypothetical protein
VISHPGGGARSRLHRVGLYLGLVDVPRPDEGLTYQQRVRAAWRRQWRSNWPFWLWLLVVLVVSASVRWYVTVLLGAGLGAVLVVLAAIWQVHRERARGR